MLDIMMSNMRTTLTLDSDVAEALERHMRRTGLGLKSAVNEALRLGLGLADTPVESRPFKVEASPLGLKPGFDRDKLNQLLDELDVEEYLRKASE